MKESKTSGILRSQSDRFREAARELGCDESEARFDAALKKVAKAPVPKDSQPKEAKQGGE